MRWLIKILNTLIFVLVSHKHTHNAHLRAHVCVRECTHTHTVERVWWSQLEMWAYLVECWHSTSKALGQHTQIPRTSEVEARECSKSHCLYRELETRLEYMRLSQKQAHKQVRGSWIGIILPEESIFLSILVSPLVGVQFFSQLCEPSYNLEVRWRTGHDCACLWC